MQAMPHEHERRLERGQQHPQTGIGPSYRLGRSRARRNGISRPTRLSREERFHHDVQNLNTISVGIPVFQHREDVKQSEHNGREHSGQRIVHLFFLQIAQIPLFSTSNAPYRSGCDCFQINSISPTVCRVRQSSYRPRSATMPSRDHRKQHQL